LSLHLARIKDLRLFQQTSSASPSPARGGMVIVPNVLTPVFLSSVGAAWHCPRQGRSTRTSMPLLRSLSELGGGSCSIDMPLLTELRISHAGCTRTSAQYACKVQCFSAAFITARASRRPNKAVLKRTHSKRWRGTQTPSAQPESSDALLSAHPSPTWPRRDEDTAPYRSGIDRANRLDEPCALNEAQESARQEHLALPKARF